MIQRPPRFARRLLEVVLPLDVRDGITGDLDEVFARDCGDAGPGRARRRYRRKAASLALYFLLDGIREIFRLRISKTDVKLGLRLLVKHPGLTLVGGLAMAFAIAVGAAAFEFVNQMVSPALPLADGHRIVGIRLWHTTAHGVEEQALWDYTQWQGRLETIDDLGVFRTVERNLIGGSVPGEPIMTAEITASAFALARVPPLLGRTLVEADERPGAPPVVVIGYDVWQSRFGGDPQAVGQTAQIGEVPRTIVGVMPESFGFPQSHSLWVPLDVAGQPYGRRQGPWVNVFGRLAPGVSLDDAQAELTVLGQRAAADFPDTHEHIRPEVLPYAETVSVILSELSPTTLRSINLFFVMLLVLVCANVALLMFARAASRQSELIIRTALGASRGRIAGQLFGEALALGGVALVAGLSAAGFALRWWLDVSRAEARGRLPFWYTDSLAATTIIYAALLTLLGAAIAGIIPALKVTGRRLETHLRRSTAGGGLKFGGIWTAVIVVQVALTVAFPATAFFIRQSVMQIRSLEAGFPAERYFAARLEMDPEFARGSDGVIRAQFPDARFRATLGELTRRLATEPGVAGVTFADQLPRTYHPLRRIEVERGSGGNVSTRAGKASVGIDYFDVLGVPVRTGRAFTVADLTPQTRTAIVNTSFVRDVLADRNAIGVRIRELPTEPTGAPGPWLQIVGVAADLGLVAGEPGWTAGYYRPAAPGTVQPSHLVIHASGDVAAVSARFQALAATIDPTLRLHDVISLATGDATMWMEFDFLFNLVTLVSGIALLLSLASIYAAMSFAVSRRTRDIGIRVALGANAVRVASATFARPFIQVGLGVLIGAGLTAALTWAIAGRVSAMAAGLIAAYAALMLCLCLLPAVTPLRRALKVDPTEALRAEA